MTKSQVLAWSIQESQRQFAEADRERKPAEEEENPFISRMCVCGHEERWHDNEDSHCDKCECSFFDVE